MSTRDPSIIAADPRHSAWVAANAGSGKTYTLANRVTRLLLAEARPERVLCLTYTKAAAAEMQARLFSQLGELAMLPDAQLAAKLGEICGRKPSPADWPKARRLFAKALETPGGLKIQTLHGFCQSVLARFPLEAGIAPGFRVLDEQTSNALIAEAREHVLEHAGTTDVFLRAAVATLVTEVTEFRLTEILRNCLGTDRRKIERFFLELEGTDGALDDAVRRAHLLEKGETADAVIDRFCSAARAEIAELRKAVAWLNAGSKSDRDKAERLAAALALDKSRDAFKAFKRALLTKEGEPLQRLATKGLADSNPTLFGQLDDFVARLFAAETRRRTAHAAELVHATLVVADAVRREYMRMKRARGVLDYDDLIVETKALLERSDAAQWILFKLDGGIDHILIDEAQDTSPEQWAIVSRLTEEFFAGAGSRSDRTLRTIFAVGDEKQSIFSFQGAEPEQFERHRDHFQAQAAAAEREFVNEPLATSRRSAPEILAFVDAVFSDPAAREGLGGTDAEIRHFAHRAKARGRVEFWPAIKPLDEPEPDPRREVDRPSEASPAARLADKVADQIQDWLQHNVRLPDHDSPIRPVDIMVLLPRREPFGSLIIRALKDRGIPVAGADRMLLMSEIVVRDLLALATFVLQPEDDLTLATLLRSPFCGLSDEQLLELCHARPARLWQALSSRADERAEFKRAHDFLAAMLARADYTPPFEFYGHALTRWEMRKRLVERLGVECEDAIEEFLSLAFSYESQNSPSLQGFVDWITDGGAEVKRDMERGRNEVRVMTVHGAKGLEADIVFLPDTTTIPQSPTQKGHLLYADDGIFFPVSDQQTPAIAAKKREAQDAVMREHRRLLYVALTRARDRLYICGFENRGGIKQGSWYRLTEAAAERLGTKFERDGETIRVFGDGADQYSLDIEPVPPRAELPPWVSPAPPEPAHPRLLRPFDAVDGEEPPANSPRGTKGAKRFERGLLVHTLLSRLPELAPDQRADVAMRYLQTRVSDASEMRALVDETLAVLADPIFAPAFAPGSRAEVALTAELPELGPGARVNGRIDRLALGDSEILIVDFKTNRPPPETQADVPAVYLAQMALYRGAAEKIFPGRRIGCALVWTDGPRLMRLSEAVLDAQLAAIRTRLDPGGGRS